MSYLDETEREAAILNRRPIRSRIALLNDRVETLDRMIEQTELALSAADDDIADAPTMVDEEKALDRYLSIDKTLDRLKSRLASTLDEIISIYQDSITLPSVER